MAEALEGALAAQETAEESGAAESSDGGDVLATAIQTAVGGKAEANGKATDTKSETKVVQTESGSRRVAAAKREEAIEQVKTQTREEAQAEFQAMLDTRDAMSDALMDLGIRRNMAGLFAGCVTPEDVTNRKELLSQFQADQSTAIGKNLQQLLTDQGYVLTKADGAVVTNGAAKQPASKVGGRGPSLLNMSTREIEQYYQAHGKLPEA